MFEKLTARQCLLLGKKLDRALRAEVAWADTDPGRGGPGLEGTFAVELGECAQELRHPEIQYGMLTDYTTGRPIRPATREEWERSMAAGATGAWQRDGGAVVYVDGGPES